MDNKHRQIRHFAGHLLYESDTAATFKDTVKEANANGARLYGADFREKDLSGISFRGKCLAGSTFWSACLIGTDFTFANVSDINFNEADLTNTIFCGADVRGSQFIDADLQAADFTDADCSQALFSHTNFRDVILTGTKLADAKIDYPRNFPKTKGDVMFVSKEAEEIANAFVDSVIALSERETFLTKAVTAEGTPAIKDLFAGYIASMADMMNASTKLHQMAAEELSTLRATVSKC